MQTELLFYTALANPPESEVSIIEAVVCNTVIWCGRPSNSYKKGTTHDIRLWYFSSSLNLFFKRACAAIQWG